MQRYSWYRHIKYIIAAMLEIYKHTEMMVRSEETPASRASKASRASIHSWSKKRGAAETFYFQPMF